jgi:hypothetical protein
MRRSIQLLASGAMLALALAPLRAQETPADPNKTWDIKAKFAVGDLLRYTMRMNMTMEMTTPSGASPLQGPQEMTTAADLKYKTVGIKPDGTAVVVLQTENNKTTLAGNEIPVPETPPITMEIDSHGVGKMRGLENLPGGQAFAQLLNMNRMPTMGVVLPDHPVKVGDNWGTTLDSPMGKIKMDCTLLGTETVGGTDTLRIKMVTSVPLDMKMGAAGAPVTDAAKAMMVMTGSVVSNAVFNILPENARIVKMAGDLTSAIKMEMKGDAASQSPFGSEMNMKMGGKMQMNLVSVGKVPAAAAPSKPSTGAPAKPAAPAKKL